MEQTISILAIGSELLDGRVLDTNSQFIAQQLEDRGARLAHVLLCDDVEAEIARSLRFLFQTSRVVILSGGLGPTTDDLTREAVASIAGVSLEQDPEIVRWLEETYRQRQRVLDPSNIKQTFFPRGSRVIPNPVGTAAGFSMTVTVDHGERTLFALPGVPGELKRMVSETVLPAIETLFSARVVRKKRGFRTFGLPEATVGERVVAAGLSPSTIVSYRAHFPEIHVLLKNADCAVLEGDFEKAKSAVGVEAIFSTELERPFEEIVHQQLVSRGLSVAVAESCTGGGLGTLLTNTPGSSACFLGGVICYSNQVKVAQLGVSSATLERHGAVSAQTAEEMAAGIRSHLNADIGIAITGIAGPDGGTEQKPVGLFYIAISDRFQNQSHRFFLSSSRRRIRMYATYCALNLLRLHCQMP